jgi:Fe-S-cluster-containing dehydrogenase component/CRP-like cAMP-binding protein
MASEVTIDRPERWDHPFDPTLSKDDVRWLLKLHPFHSMDASAFPQSAALEEILRNDSRIRVYEPGDVILREGEYAASAFIVLEGQVRTLLLRLEDSQREKSTKQPLSWLSLLKDSMKRWPIPEVRRVAKAPSLKTNPSAGDRELGIETKRVGNQHKPRIFLQDASSILSADSSTPLTNGEIFGEMAAITRSPSHYTAIAESACTILEIRWQGLRLLRRDPAFQVDHRYRAGGLKTHLRETDLFRFLPPEQLDRIADSTELVSYGDREWFSSYKNHKHGELSRQISKEPVICEEGSPVNALFLIRSGFARRSFRVGAGHRTLEYLGRGASFGLREIVENVRREAGNRDVLPFQESLRCIGFVDVLRISREAFIQYALPYVRDSELPSPIRKPRYNSRGFLVDDENLQATQSDGHDPALIEFLVDERLVNGKQVMLIDTDLCTRCDDCVTACAKVHHGNPRFSRSGPQFGSYQVAHACMHCSDPVCMIGCPTGAIARDTVTGIISINDSTCIGCSVCAESCPYENIQMAELHDERGRKILDKETKLPILQATKCDLCHHLPTGPACQTACPHQALVRIDASDLPILSNWMERAAS